MQVASSGSVLGCLWWYTLNLCLLLSQPLPHPPVFCLFLGNSIYPLARGWATSSASLFFLCPAGHSTQNPDSRAHSLFAQP